MPRKGGGGRRSVFEEPGFSGASPPVCALEISGEMSACRGSEAKKKGP
jgi:hypothetical protein